jgi:beta-xylosidase
MWPGCAAEVTVDASGLKDGDVAGLCALQGCYGYVGITKELGNLYLIVVDRRLEETRQNDRTADYLPGNLREKVKLTENRIRLRINIEMEDGHNTAEFFYQNKNRWKRAGDSHRLFFRLDHCMGCRFGLFLYSTENTGGQALFQNFRYIYDE